MVKAIESLNFEYEYELQNHLYKHLQNVEETDTVDSNEIKTRQRAKIDKHLRPTVLWAG